MSKAGARLLMVCGITLFIVSIFNLSDMLFDLATIFIVFSIAFQMTDEKGG